jgi:hypothetical protein
MPTLQIVCIACIENTNRWHHSHNPIIQTTIPDFQYSQAANAWQDSEHQIPANAPAQVWPVAVASLRGCQHFATSDS